MLVAAHQHAACPISQSTRQRVVIPAWASAAKLLRAKMRPPDVGGMWAPLHPVARISQAPKTKRARPWERVAQVPWAQTAQVPIRLCPGHRHHRRHSGFCPGHRQHRCQSGVCPGHRRRCQAASCPGHGTPQSLTLARRCTAASVSESAHSAFSDLSGTAMGQSTAPAAILCISGSTSSHFVHVGQHKPSSSACRAAPAIMLCMSGSACSH